MTGFSHKIRSLFTSRFRKQLSIFVICLLIAIVLWFLLMVPNQEKQPIKFPLTFTHIPAGKVLVSASDNFLYLKFNTSHYQVISKAYLKRPVPLNIDLSALRLVRIDSHYESSLATAKLTGMINEQFGSDNGITISYPDTIFFTFRDTMPEQMESPTSRRYPTRLLSPIMAALILSPPNSALKND